MIGLEPRASVFPCRSAASSAKANRAPRYFATLAELADHLGKRGAPAATSAMVGIATSSAEASFYAWVDQHNTLGLANDVPISTGNENDALLALVEEKWWSCASPIR
jgi:1,6-anhydro-N-acetylmuramate kinase